MNYDSIIKENARRNAFKKADYDPVSGLNCCGDRFLLQVPEKYPYKFYLPLEMENLPSVVLLKRHEGSISDTLRSINGKKPTDDQIDYFWLKLCEERYKYDFEFFAIACETIIDKLSARPIRFKLNRAQRRLLKKILEQLKEGRQINVQILKAKQMGFSTLVEMIFKWIQIVHKKNWNSVICAHDQTAAINIRAMYGDSVKEMVPIGGEKMTMGNFESTHNIKLINQTGCRITVGTALKPESTRSQNVKMVHFSEMAFYPDTDNNNPALIETSVISSMTDGPFTAIIRESTANGEGDYFHKQWLLAKKGETAYYPFFAPWFEIELYEILFDGKYVLPKGGKTKKGTVQDFIDSMTESEWLLFNNHKECTLENLNWYRWKLSTMPSEWQMKQEYPSNDIEAFQSSGNPVFNIDHLEALRPDCCEPDAVGMLVSKCSPHLSVTEPNRRREILKDLRFETDAEATDAVLNGDPHTRFKKGMNRLWVWQYPDTEEKISDRYEVVFDPQKGTSKGADFGVIKVIDRYWMQAKYGGKPEVVALFYGHIDKDITIWIATQVAKWYNNALLVVESNTYDSDIKEDDTPFIFEMIKDHYDNLYSRTDPEKVREGAPIKWGFNTNKATKPMVIESFKAILREKAYVERDEETINEGRTFEEKDNHKMGAKAGCHDDRLMATAIGLYVCFNEMPLPRVIETVVSSPVVRTAW